MQFDFQLENLNVKYWITLFFFGCAVFDGLAANSERFRKTPIFSRLFDCLFRFFLYCLKPIRHRDKQKLKIQIACLSFDMDITMMNLCSSFYVHMCWLPNWSYHCIRSYSRHMCLCVCKWMFWHLLANSIKMMIFSIPFASWNKNENEIFGQIAK